MLLDRMHRNWALSTTAALALSTACYVWSAQTSPHGPQGGSRTGLLFGFAGALCMLFAGLLSARKKTARNRWGSAQWWLRGHLWLGLLSGPLVLFHCGFRLGGGLETALMAVFAVVYLSGLFGVALQQFLPRLITSEAPRQGIYEQIPRVCEALRARGDRVVSQACGALLTPRSAGASYVASEELRTFYLGIARPFLNEPPARGELAADTAPAKDRRDSRRHGAPQNPIRNAHTAALRFEELRFALPDKLHQVVDQLEALCDERRELLAQQKIHHWLHGWLFLHVPLSLTLLILGLLHAVMSLWY